MLLDGDEISITQKSLIPIPVPVLDRILLVEDDLDIQTIGRLALEIVGGFTVTICSSGQECLTIAPEFKPDLILLDVMMPGMDGLTTLKALKELSQLCHIPIIFMTAKVQTHEVVNYKALGAIGVISKPFDPMILATDIQALWREYYA